MVNIIIFLGVLCFLGFFFWNKKEKQRMDHLLDALSEGVVIIDSRLRIRKMNRRAGSYFGVVPRKVIGRPFSFVEQPLYLELVQEALSLRKSIRKSIRGKKGNVPLEVTASNDGKGKIVLLMQEQKNEQRAAELTRDFIANASHELKTPIAIISGFAETLHDHPELSQKVRNDITGRIVDNCERMVALVKSLLTLATLDEGIPEERLHRFDPKIIAEKARATILALHPIAEITILQKSKFTLKADKDLLLQAVLNLLDNAVKYSGTHPKIEIILDQDEESYILAVRDYGQGIAAENVERIFERFYAVDKSISRSLGGYGLGLSIVQRIIEKHQGQIDVTSEEGKGSTFSLHFPK